MLRIFQKQLILFTPLAKNIYTLLRVVANVMQGHGGRTIFFFLSVTTNPGGAEWQRNPCTSVKFLTNMSTHICNQPYMLLLAYAYVCVRVPISRTHLLDSHTVLKGTGRKNMINDVANLYFRIKFKKSVSVCHFSSITLPWISQ